MGAMLPQRWHDHTRATDDRVPGHPQASRRRRPRYVRQHPMRQRDKSENRIKIDAVCDRRPPPPPHSVAATRGRVPRSTPDRSVHTHRYGVRQLIKVTVITVPNLLTRVPTVSRVVHELKACTSWNQRTACSQLNARATGAMLGRHISTHAERITPTICHRNHGTEISR
eukprot:COSAG01_NODE_7660_length_3109_cov_10.560797_2_plen_169_part_00